MAFKYHTEKLMACITPKALFRQIPKLRFSSNLIECPVCKIKLKVKKTRKKIIGTLYVGMVKTHETLLECSACNNYYGSEDLLNLVPYRSRFGYDIIVYTGKSMFLKCKNESEIREELEAKSIKISASEINYLARKFIIYLAIAHRESSEELRTYMNSVGGYILHLDATCEGDSPHLMTGLDEISNFVLDNIKIPSEKGDKIVPFLQNIKQAYGNPQALVHDMGKGILSAVSKVFPNTPDFICHFHFLRDIGKDLFEKENDIIRKRLRIHGIQTALRKKLAVYKKMIEKNPDSITQLSRLLKKGNNDEGFKKYASPEVLLYTLILWAFQGKKQGDGYGFPFDRPYLYFYKRLEKIHSIIKQMKQTVGKKNVDGNKLYTPIYKNLSSIIRDSKLKEAALLMQEKCKVFDKLRRAMRIALHSGKFGLNDKGTGENIKSIESKVKRFYEWLCHYDKKSKEDYRKTIQQINKYWEKLFADPITVKSPCGEIIIQPQRTNNILEQFFRDLKRSYCKKTGFAAINKTLKAMLSDTPLVKNLDNHEYMKILLNGKDSLEARFAEIDSVIVRKELMKKNQVKMIPPEIVKFIKEPKLPEIFAAFFAV